MKIVRPLLWILAMLALLVTSYVAAGSVLMPGSWTGVFLAYRLFYLASFVISIACVCAAAVAKLPRRKRALLAIPVVIALADIAFVWWINR
ncbi:hypothetical protein [Novosphingobium sp. 9]|uniref:hypothetical protein n=1 Tax=Novosphingobium sp. 9 TaxID=2025349 RepID=UPI0021B53C4A|nr:hypothetical protein [Novosphingobium sp. 9]